VKIVIKVGVLLLVGRRISLSYIDPNTGGMLFQMLAVLFGLLSGLLFFFSGRIKLLIARFRRSTRGEEDAVEGSDLSNLVDGQDESAASDQDRNII
jgi:hypothetical protein